MLNRFSVAQKMKWASQRNTTREEDIAYCLMGLFDINMPLLYGEGTRAFFRLQKAILEMRSDHSILAFRSPWSFDWMSQIGPGFLAPSPSAFRDDIRSIHTRAPGMNTSLSGTTLSIDMLICPVQAAANQQDLYLGILDCSIGGDPYMIPAILLSAVHKDRAIFRSTFKTTNLFLLHSSHPGEARGIMDTGMKPDPSMFITINRRIQKHS
jgi:hypothetical protein